jgi:hypothetical protein
MEYTAAVTVAALMRDLPATLKLTELGDELLNSGSADRLWNAHMRAALAPPSLGGDLSPGQISAPAAAAGGLSLAALLGLSLLSPG